MTALTKSRLTELLERVEAASGADRELDVRLTLLLNDGSEINGQLPYNDAQVELLLVLSRPGVVECEDCGHESTAAWVPVPAYTASLDAALALVDRVLPGWDWVREYGGRMIVFNPASDDTYGAKGSVPALALLAAMLRALADGEG